MKKTYLLKGTYLLALAAAFEIWITTASRSSVIVVLMAYAAMAATFIGIIYGIAGFFGKDKPEEDKTKTDE